MESLNKDIIVSLAKYLPSHIILFGSYSRGDYNIESDIDILEITKDEHKPYSINNINYSTYTLNQLRKMANSGNLFVLHIILEGKVLKGDPKIIEFLKIEFNKPTTYQKFRDEIIFTSQLLDVNENTFLNNRKGYYGLLCYLFRSFLYSIMADANQIKYSINGVSEFFIDNKIIDIFNIKHKQIISFSNYENSKTVFENYAKTRFVNKFEDANTLIKNFRDNSSFASSLGFHFLKDSLEEITY